MLQNFAEQRIIADDLPERDISSSMAVGNLKLWTNLAVEGLQKSLSVAKFLCLLHATNAYVCTAVTVRNGIEPSSRAFSRSEIPVPLCFPLLLAETQKREFSKEVVWLMGVRVFDVRVSRSLTVRACCRP